MFILKGVLLFQIWLNRVALMKIHNKLMKLSKAGTGTGKICLKFVAPNSFFSSLLRCSILMEKTAAVFLILLQAVV